MLKIVKPTTPIDHEWLWQYDDGEKDINVFDAPTKVYLVFGIFYLDRFAKETFAKVEGILQQVQANIQEWNTLYPWSEYNGISMELKYMNDGLPYIFGQLCEEDNIQNEESLVVAMLQEVSLQLGSQLFIKISATDGDNILAEFNECIPEEYEYPVANNRFWIYEGKFVMIPTYFYEGRGLKPNEALEFLTKAPFKCIEIDKLSQCIRDKIINPHPNATFAELGKLMLVIEDQDFLTILKDNSQIISYLVKSLIKDEITNVQDIIKKENVSDQDKNQPTEFLIPKNHANLLSLYLDIHKLKDDPLKIPMYCGRILHQVFKSLIDNSELKINEVSSATVKWKESNLLKDYKFETIALEEPFKPQSDVEPTEELMDKLGNFFKSDMDKEFNDSSLKENKLSNVDSEDEFSDEREGNDQAKKYFEDENISIDEDDFFEFFLKEALKLKEEEIETFRKQDSKKEQTVGDLQKKTNLDVEDDGESELRELVAELDTDSQEGAIDAFTNLFDSLSVDGAPSGPFQTMLRNLSEQNGHKNET
ncbi:uncharacterized protein NDAI_0E02380 [Naumovozyma dairenensis CBS 421]|uniref:Uncharacterized protein n=1 Tax=Naumovozyma dairenensis (strain ATCC 10597 / BCRC 20456 / CBS 421 / NBRC 0211 / NRRL Y-12639) TaxID=1071378 RepID=G0WBD5_NAUDC|nr:hypothetical protein NDAI_0E02380 [Naumovozyma dairenensis CBS 421]CCD25055.1 hypothetical protein NDAI_0E02380 [Naumovozyma dairenensis CBS 421]